MAKRATRKHKTQVEKFCSCIKKVRKTMKLRPGQKNRESAAIGTCVKAILQTRGRTLKKFRCLEKPMLQTQRMK